MDDRVTRWSLLTVGVLGLGLSILAGVRVARGGARKARRNSQIKTADYYRWLDKVCPGRQECDDAAVASGTKEDECKYLDTRHQKALGAARLRLEQQQEAVEKQIEQTRSTAEFALSQWEWLKKAHRLYNVAAEHDPWNAERLKREQRRVSSRTENYHVAEWEAEQALMFLAEAEDALDLRLEEVRDAKRDESFYQSKARDCWLDCARAQETEGRLCGPYNSCRHKHPGVHEWMEMRNRRMESKAPDPLSFPMDAGETRFGVEMEMVFPEERATPREDIAFAVARALGVAPKAPTGGDTWVIIDRKGKKWKVVSDLSLGENGAEVVTPVLGLWEIEDVQRVVRAVAEEGAMSSGAINAGLHVHVSHPTQKQRAAAIVQAAADLDAKIERHPHRAEEWAKHLPEAFVRSIEPGMSEEDILQLWYASQNEVYPRTFYKQSPTRYHGVNLHALPYMGTYEVRAFDGTLDPDVIKRAILQSAKMVTTRMYKNNRRRARRRRSR